MRRPAAAIVVVLALVACADAPTVTLPEGAAETMRSVVYALELADGALEVSVARIDEPVEVEVGPDVDFVRVLLYEDDVTLAFASRGRLPETSVHQFLRAAPLELDSSATFGTSTTTGGLVYALESTSAQYVGFEKGYFVGAGDLVSYPGDWDGSAVRYRFGQGPSSFIAYALLDSGAVRTQTSAGPWSELVDLGPSSNRPFLEFKPPDVFEAYRDSGYTRVSDGRVRTFELPVQGNVSSLRKIIRDGTVIRVLGTDAGEVAHESGADVWTALARSGTEAPVVGADYWLDAWFVFDAAGLMHQLRLDGTLCEPVAALEGETALGMFATQAGYHVWSEDTLAFITRVAR